MANENKRPLMPSEALAIINRAIEAEGGTPMTRQNLHITVLPAIIKLREHGYDFVETVGDRRKQWFIDPVAVDAAARYAAERVRRVKAGEWNPGRTWRIPIAYVRGAQNGGEK